MSKILKIYIFGKSGTGKTTFSQFLSKKLSIPLCSEEDFTKVFQDKFLNKPHRYCFHNQLEFMENLFNSEYITNGNIVLDSSFRDIFNVYTKVFFQEQYLSKDEYYLLQHIYKNKFEKVTNPTHWLFIDCPYSISIHRRKRRNRNLDNMFPEKLLKLIELEFLQYYERIESDPQKNVKIIDSEKLSFINMNPKEFSKISEFLKT